MSFEQTGSYITSHVSATSKKTRSAIELRPFQIIRPRRSRSAAAYSRQTFPWTICRSVRRSVQCIVKNGSSDPDAVCHHRSDGSRDEAGRPYWGLGIGPLEGVLWGANFGRAIVTNGDFTEYVCDSAATRPSSQIALGKLVKHTIKLTDYPDILLSLTKHTKHNGA